MRCLILLMVFGLTGLFSCMDSNEHNLAAEATNGKEILERNLDHQEVPGELLQLKDPGEIDSVIDQNLYGKFFNERAEYYIIDHPTNKIHDSMVRSITLCFLDGHLSRTKYILYEDVSGSLIQSLGNFKISGHDQKNREILKSGKVWIPTGQGFGLNPLLDNYELKWIFEDNLITYKVNLNNKQEPFRYVEKLKTYDRNFKMIERYH
jgi:hypothetical protein